MKKNKSVLCEDFIAVQFYTQKACHHTNLAGLRRKRLVSACSFSCWHVDKTFFPCFVSFSRWLMATQGVHRAPFLINFQMVKKHGLFMPSCSFVRLLVLVLLVLAFALHVRGSWQRRELELIVIGAVLHGLQDGTRELLHAARGQLGCEALAQQGLQAVADIQRLYLRSRLVILRDGVRHGTWP